MISFIKYPGKKCTECIHLIENRKERGGRAYVDFRCEFTQDMKGSDEECDVELFMEDELNQKEVIKLKPCPFCGGMAHIAYNVKRKIYNSDEYRTGVAIYCGACEARMFYKSEKLAVKAWNRRAGDEEKSISNMEREENDDRKLLNDIRDGKGLQPICRR